METGSPDDSGTGVSSTPSACRTSDSTGTLQRTGWWDGRQCSDTSLSEARPEADARFPSHEADCVGRAGTLPRLRSLLVQQHGTLIGERYFRGATRTRTANIKSASKTIVAAATRH